MKAYYSANGGGSVGSFSAIEQAFMRSRGASGTAYDDLAYNYWTSFGPAIGPANVSNGIAGWWKADNMGTSYADNASVSSWADSSGNGRTLSQGTGANQPLYRSSSGVIPLPNSKPVVQFDGVSDYLLGSGFSLLTGLAEATGFLVFAPTTAGYAGPRLGIFNGATTNDYQDGFQMQTATAQTIPYTALDYGGVKGGADNQFTVSSTGQNVYAVMTAVWSTGIAAYFNGTSVGSNSTNGGTLNASNIVLGARFYSGIVQNAYAPVGIAEAIFYNRALNTTDRQAVESYLRTKYGTP
jgi:hypothetical protein